MLILQLQEVQLWRTTQDYIFKKNPVGQIRPRLGRRARVLWSDTKLEEQLQRDPSGWLVLVTVTQGASPRPRPKTLPVYLPSRPARRWRRSRVPVAVRDRRISALLFLAPQRGLGCPRHGAPWLSNLSSLLRCLQGTLRARAGTCGMEGASPDVGPGLRGPRGKADGAGAAAY